MQNKKVGKASAKRIMAMFYFALLILAFLLQTSVFPLLPFLSASPNLLLILCFSFGFYYGSLPGMFYGLCAGLLMDLFYSGPFGFYSLIFVLIGYGNGYFHHYPATVSLCSQRSYLSSVYLYFPFCRSGKGEHSLLCPAYCPSLYCIFLFTYRSFISFFL